MRKDDRTGWRSLLILNRVGAVPKWTRQIFHIQPHLNTLKQSQPNSCAYSHLMRGIFEYFDTSIFPTSTSGPSIISTSISLVYLIISTIPSLTPPPLPHSTFFPFPYAFSSIPFIFLFKPTTPLSFPFCPLVQEVPFPSRCDCCDSMSRNEKEVLLVGQKSS